MSFYPVFLNLRGRRAVVIGGGAIAEQKVGGLLEAGAQVVVVSPELTWKLEDLAATGAIALERRAYRPGDLARAFVAIAATDDRSVNALVWEEAEDRGVLLNAVDDLPHCSFIAPAVHRVGDIAVAVSTGGKSPALAVRLRERIATLIGAEHAQFLEILGALRPEVAARVPDTRARTRLWYEIVDSDAVEAVRRGDVATARRRIEELVAATAGAPRTGTPVPGMVYLVGAGPGDPGLLTVRGVSLLRTADVVVYDRLVHPDTLKWAAPWAERVFVGKRAAGPSVNQERTNELLIERALAGHVVVRLKGGDPFVFGRGAEESEALGRAGITVQVVPGVSAAIAAPAAAGIPVTHRRVASAFAVAAGHECAGDSDLDWEALARIPTVVFLMGLRGLPRITGELLAHGARPETPAAVIANATLPNQQQVVGTLATIAALAAAAGLEPPATLVVGEVVRIPEELARLPHTAVSEAARSAVLIDA
ncbi:MAG TPA: siroheme synthase CysG [Gemmatimonadales bacterium]|nr:siroheme synthase CysG [Gemmatimonadales bacterium]